MSDRTPSFFMLVPGPWKDAEQLGRTLAAQDTSALVPVLDRTSFQIVEDGELEAGFGWGRQGPLAPEVVARVGDCSHAALIEFDGRLDEEAARVAALGRAFRAAGGVAIRMEASGAASDWEPWLQGLESGDPRRIYESAVVIVRDEDVIFTCGMHHFDLPDAELSVKDAQEGSDSQKTQRGVNWLDAFCVYQLAEKPGLLSGHTFQPNEGAPRRAFERWPDHRHPPEDGRHNPFGVWRFLEPGASGIAAGKLVPVLIPTLASLLTAAERSAGRALSPREVQTIVSGSTATTMEPRDLQALERSRGYADIEPARAWEQWQIVREWTTGED